MFDDIHTLFLYTCKIEQLNISKWLYSLNVINIHANNDYAFGIACTHGCLKNSSLAL